MINEETEKMRKKRLKQINTENPDIIQDNADLLELERRYENLDIPSKARQIIDDYIACIQTRDERLSELCYIVGMKEGGSSGSYFRQN